MENNNECRDFSKVKWKRRRRRAVRGSVRSKVKKLQRLIPGGKGLQPDHLFLRTADYILQLRLQVNVLQALSKIYTP
ncbi:transcription factor PAR1 [Jatropha curcas]|uniref:transcription factor PAR1 n=1 Tax=Jatropha curcas TaxID=180498 RepID=UPI0005FC244D|nr:transcription factor PAR1 [Jatropha curcas]